ncbi:MAG: hypothetical protein IPI33_16960 [Dehalococcoidia bacterium]|nr:hypothetical protein [Dehalococcoidia bacterium]
MTEPLQVGQFAIVDGEPVDRGPNAGVFHGKGPADDRAELFILAEGTTPAGEAFAGRVISDLGQVFAGLDMSLTGSLGRLFQEAERNVGDWNRKSIAQHRVALGLSAFGRRGEQAVIAQAGPTAAFLLHDGRMTSFCADGEHGSALGSAPVQPQLTRIPFGEGDRLLLLSSSAVIELDDELIEGILALPEEQVLPNLYRRLQQMRQATVLLVTGPRPEGLDDTEETAGDDYIIGGDSAAPGRESGGMFQPSLFIEDEDEGVVLSARAHLLEVTPHRAIASPAPLMAMEAPAPLLRAAGESAISINRLAAEGAARAARSRAAVATISAEAAAAPAAVIPAWRTPGGGYVAHSPVNVLGNQPPSSNRPRKTQSFSRGLVSSGAPPARPELLAEDLPLAAELAAGQRARSSVQSSASETLAAENGAAINGGTALVRPRTNMGGRWKGGNSFGHRSVVAGQLPPAWMVILGALIILVLLAGIATVPRLLRDGDGERVETLLTGAQQRVAASNAQVDPAQKRQLLTEAQAMLLAVREKGENAQAEQLISEVAGAISKMDSIFEPQRVEAIASLEQFGTKPVAVSRIAAGNDAVYLLDVNSAQVIAVRSNGAEPQIVFSENKDEKRGKPIAIAHLDESDLGGPVLLIADAANKLWMYSRVDGLRTVSFAAPANLAISDITVNGPDLFVLDAGQSTIYRYLQTPQGFPNAPLAALKNSDLGNARRLMVDGEFITTDADGTVHRFIAGGQTAITFSQAGIDRKLVAPEAVQAMTDRSEVAILDASNDRIVVLRRDGGFARQYRHKDFDGASAFVIRKGDALIFSGGQLRRVIF